MALHFSRTVRTESSERFLLQSDSGHDSAALELHYLGNHRVVGTLIILDERVFPESKLPELLKEIDEKLLPDVSMEEGQLSFTVVAGHVVGTFFPHPA
jgi:hypothetical protein